MCDYILEFGHKDGQRFRNNSVDRYQFRIDTCLDMIPPQRFFPAFFSVTISGILKSHGLDKTKRNKSIEIHFFKSPVLRLEFQLETGKFSIDFLPYVP